jgi:alcohol dehydrogenase
MFGVVTDPALGRKVLVAHPSVQAVVIVLDPELGVGAPPDPLSDAMALQAIRAVGRYLPRAFDEGTDLEARAQMLLAAHLAGIAFTNSGLGICHAMGHPLSARFDAAHGQTLATLLPHIMRFNRDAVAEKYAEVAAALDAAEPGAPAEQNADRAVAAVERLRARVRTDLGAAALGVRAEQIPTLVEDAFADVLMFATPKFPKPEDVTKLYEAAL